MSNSSVKDLNMSSSGSIFPLLAREILSKGGVVFGARWNENWEVVHSYCEDEENLKFFQGSKYAQSRIDDNYKQAKKFLDEGRFVLFTGVPCHILALKRFLRKDYPNLLCVDIFCHSISSPYVWQLFLDSFIGNRKKEDIVDIKFRKKIKNELYGTLSSIFVIEFKNGDILDGKFYSTSYGRLFAIDIITRQSCMNCPCENLESLSDISIGDFWGGNNYYPELDPNEGVSLAFVKTSNGYNALENILNHCSVVKEVKKDECLANKGLLWKRRKITPKRSVFFGQLKKAKNNKKKEVLDKFLKASFIRRVISKIRRILK